MSLLGGIGSALSGFAATDLQLKHDQEERTRAAEQKQLQGLQLLLQQNDLPMRDYADAITALGSLTGHKPTKQVADFLHQQLDQHQVVDQVNPQPAAPGTQAARVESGIGPPPPMTQVSRETFGEMPRNVYVANALLPSQIAKYNAQQAEKARYDTENDARTQERQLAVAKLKGQQALDRLPIVLENRLKIVDETAKNRARAEVDKLVAGGMSAEDASAYVLNKTEQDKNLRTARIGVLQAQKLAIPERIAQGWANVDAATVRNEIAADVAKRGTDMAAFDRDTSWAFKDLDSVNREIDSLQKRPDLLNGADPAWTNQLQGLQAQQAALLNQIYLNKGKYVPDAAAPRRGLSAPPSRKPGAIQPNEDPNVRAYANRYFHGDYAAADAYRRAHP